MFTPGVCVGESAVSSTADFSCNADSLWVITFENLCFTNKIINNILLYTHNHTNTHTRTHTRAHTFFCLNLKYNTTPVIIIAVPAMLTATPTATCIDIFDEPYCCINTKAVCACACVCAGGVGVCMGVCVAWAYACACSLPSPLLHTSTLHICDTRTTFRICISVYEDCKIWIYGCISMGRCLTWYVCIRIFSMNNEGKVSHLSMLDSRKRVKTQKSFHLPAIVD